MKVPAVVGWPDNKPSFKVNTVWIGIAAAVEPYGYAFPATVSRFKLQTIFAPYHRIRKYFKRDNLNKTLIGNIGVLPKDP